MGKATLRNFIDVHVRSDYPTRNFSTPGLLRVAAGAELAYLFAPRPFPLGATVTSAKLRLFSRDPVGTSVTLSLGQVAARTTLTRVTFDTMPALKGTPVSVTRTSPPWDALWEFDVTAHMQQVAAGEAWYGWRVASSATQLLRLYSADSGAAFRPELVVEWADNPSPPSTLAPSANRAVSIASPLLKFDFTDVSGDTTLAAVHVQVNGSPITTGTPAFDSGARGSTVPELDLAAVGYAGLAVGASAYWRVKVQDGADLWSSWSDWVQWSRVAKVAVAITSPGAVVSDPEPVARWTVTGGTQSAYQVIVYDGVMRVLWHSGKVASSAARSHAIPAGVMRRDDGRYFVRVRVWDTIAREAVPGDPTYVQETLAVHFDRDGSLTPITGFTATPNGDQTGMTLAWNRAVTPERWVVLRDGDVVSVLSPTGFAAPGGGWRWTDYRADPRRTHVWEVAPVINGVTGKAGPLMTGQLAATGVWLADPTSGERFVLYNESLTWGYGEQSTVHEPLGARAPVLITQGMRGHEGAVSGRLADSPPMHGTKTAQERRDAVLALKERPGRTYRLILADQNIPVVVWGINVSPAPAGDKVGFDVGFSFAQVGEYDYDPDLGAS